MNFPFVPLSDVTTVIAGQSPPGHTYNDNGVGLPFFQGKTDFGELHPIARKWCTAPKKIAERGDILISVRAPVGPTNVADSRCCIGRGLAAIRPDGTAALRDFVLWSLRHRETELVAMGQGSTFAAISQKNLKSLQLPLPPLDQQRRIVSILNRMAKITRLRRQAQERLREFIPALFIKMFGGPVESPKALKIPAVPIGELCVLINGRAFKPTDWANSGIPIVRIQNLRDPSKPVNRFDGAVQDKHLIDSGDVLLSWSGTPGTSFGCFVWNRGRAVLNQHIFRVEYDRSRIERDYFVHAMNSRLDEMIQRAHGGVGLRHITKTELNKIKLPVPPPDEQRRFSNLVSQADAFLTSTAAAESRANALSAALMSRLLGASA